MPSLVEVGGSARYREPPPILVGKIGAQGIVHSPGIGTQPMPAIPCPDHSEPEPDPPEKQRHGEVGTQINSFQHAGFHTPRSCLLVASYTRRLRSIVADTFSTGDVVQSRLDCCSDWRVQVHAELASRGGFELLSETERNRLMSACLRV